MPTIPRVKPISLSPAGAVLALARDGQPRTGASGAQRFTLDAMAHMRLRARVNGLEADAIMDTGAARTLLDPAFAARLGLAVRPGFQVAGITGPAQGGWIDRVTLTIGDLSLDGFQPGVLDLGPMTGGADLLIGRDFFDRTAAEFDFARGGVSFWTQPPQSLAAGYYTAPLGLTPGGTPFVALSVNGRAPIHAALDIGYNGSLMISASHAEAAGLLAGRRCSTVASIGAEGVCINRLAACDRVEFAGSELTEVPIEVPAAWNRPIPAVLGLEILRRYRMMAEFGRQRVSFLPDPALAGTPLPKDRSGIGGRPTPDGVMVVHVARGSPAEGIGLRAGEVITRINGERADLDYVCRHPRLGAGPAGTHFLLQIDDDRVATLTLSEYY